MARFLKRHIKKDRKGLFVNYGWKRIRYKSYWCGQTKFTFDQIVNIIEAPLEGYWYVFINDDYVEAWEE